MGLSFFLYISLISGPVNQGGGIGPVPTGTGLYSEASPGNGITPVQPALVPSAPTYNPPT